MEIKRIKTKDEHNAAIARMEAIGDREDFGENPELFAEFENLSYLVSSYEKKAAPLEDGHPLAMIKLKMESLDIKQKDLIPLIGSSGVVSDVFNRKRGLSKEMIRKFSELLHIDQQALNRKYELANKPAQSAAKKQWASQFSYANAFSDRICSFKDKVRTNKMLFNINAGCAA